jgi:hypothetical protein
MRILEDFGELIKCECKCGEIFYASCDPPQNVRVDPHNKVFITICPKCEANEGEKHVQPGGMGVQNSHELHNESETTQSNSPQENG